ncbi:hypothetical protein E2C01_042368 [Portunus trituberculatus]|uniref:Uncharacterized protein n=1 Tax=Portunus trituberculatus TaxID=210409 RepID=A0A5B7FLQ0_PORTR|nr:hypothetical protein [Portunus trituberculatus]
MNEVLLLNIYGDQLIVLTADCHITVYNLQLPQTDSAATGTHLPQWQLRKAQDGTATDTGILLGKDLWLARGVRHKYSPQNQADSLRKSD